MTRLRQRLQRGDDGFTMTELLVAMSVLAIVMSIISAATIMMLKDVRKQQGISDNLDGLRKATDLMDQQMRYANGISQPGLSSDAKAAYVEFQTANIAQTPTCTQWRLDTRTSLLQWRTWTVVNLSPVPTSPTWNTALTGAVPLASGLSSTFSTSALAPGATASATATATASASPSASSASIGHATLSVQLGALHGGKDASTGQTFQTFTAQNTSGTSTSSPVCQQLASERP